jgi:hypothetical protein
VDERSSLFSSAASSEENFFYRRHLADLKILRRVFDEKSETSVAVFHSDDIPRLKEF